ncbi:DUF4157 domain-containing protein [Sphingomonas sp. BT-65]|uniref:eCIS core domain-containing protein n=1 Tax=Sphingomonas sp. BT-65 TaxID=2989821 RepID=UPI002236995A|nr:DUF4157 domain-containing protein [Sphingomonas sp. BT-65]MCW4460963.1 DUF4157 domain-containing protein [Sphingomonas sp. BT-65]
MRAFPGRSVFRPGVGPAVPAPAPAETQAQPVRDRPPADRWLAFLTGQGVHPKLAVSTPGDADEREADALADRVMRMTAPAPGPLPVSATNGAALARACCASCEADDDETPIARKAADGGGVAQRSAHSAAAAVANGGAPLASAERAFFEPRFGHDLSGVRIHTDARAAQAARGINALAYTHGQNIAFAPGHYRPGTSEGRRLLAHELAHTLQHSGGAPLLGGHADTPGAMTIRRQTADTIYRQCPPPEMRRGGAAGCGICMGGNFGAIGAIVHQLIQYQFFFADPTLVPSGPGMELVVPTVPEGDTPPFNPEVDLSRISDWHGLRTIEIAEIKPFDDAGVQIEEARHKLDDYGRELREGGLFDDVRLLEAPPPAPFPLAEPTRPPGCPPQMIHVCQIEPGIYQYYCSPSWAEAQRNPACRCGRRERRERERERVRDRVREPYDVPIAPPVGVPDAPGVPEGHRPPVGVPDTPIPVNPPVVVPAPPVTVPEGPVSVPEGPVEVPEGPVSVPEGPVEVPEGPVSVPDGPIWLPGWDGEPANDNVEAGDEGMQEAARVALAATAAAAALWAIRRLGGAAARRFLAPLEAAALAALVIFYSDRAEAGVGPGDSPLESLFDAMEQDGIPIDDEMRARIEADPALRDALENAARSGDLTEAQRAIAQRTMEIIAENPDAFSDEDLRILAEGMEAATNSDPATQPTVESLRRAIEARRRGEPIGPIIDQGLQDAREGVSRAPEAEPDPASSEAEGGVSEPVPEPAPETPAEPLPIPQEYRDRLAATPERERLFREMTAHHDGLPLTDAMIERFLATVPEDLTAEQADALIDRVVAALDATEDEIFAQLEQAVAEVRAATPDEPGEVIEAPAPGPVPEAPAPEEPAPVPAETAPAEPDAAPAPRGLTEAQLTRLREFIAGNPRPGRISPLPSAENRVPHHRFTRLVAMAAGDGTLVAGFMTMRITTVRSVNDFDVIMSPTVFYRADGRRRGIWPPTPTSTDIQGE